MRKLGNNLSRSTPLSSWHMLGNSKHEFGALSYARQRWGSNSRGDAKGAGTSEEKSSQTTLSRLRGAKFLSCRAPSVTSTFFQRRSLNTRWQCCLSSVAVKLQKLLIYASFQRSWHGSHSCSRRGKRTNFPGVGRWLKPLRLYLNFLLMDPINSSGLHQMFCSGMTFRTKN